MFFKKKFEIFMFFQVFEIFINRLIFFFVLKFVNIKNSVYICSEKIKFNFFKKFMKKDAWHEA